MVVALKRRRRRFRIPPGFWSAQQRTVLALRNALRPRLTRVWRRMGRHVVERLDELVGDGKAAKSRPVTPADLSPEDEDAIARLLRGHARVTIEQAANDAAELLGLGGAFNLPMAEVQRVLDELATRIQGINDTTRRHVRRIVGDSLAEGASIPEIRDRLRGLFEETYRGRAETVARTESAFAYNHGSLLAYRESGLVEQVLVFDGDDCGWRRHDDPDKAHGSRRSLEDARAHPLAHTNCRRAFGPVLSDDAPPRVAEPNQQQPGQQPQQPQQPQQQQRPLSRLQFARMVRRTENQIVSNQQDEEAYAWASDGTQLLYKVGQGASVSFTNAEIAALRGKEAVFTHNHPLGWGYAVNDPRRRGNSFSPEDLLLGIDADVAEIRAASPGWRHSMKPGPNGWPSEHTLRAEYQQVDSQVRNQNWQAIQTQQLTIPEAEANHFHQIWIEVARRLGLTYKRYKR